MFIDGKSVMIEQGSALIQACEKAGADVSIALLVFFLRFTKRSITIDSPILLPR